MEHQVKRPAMVVRFWNHSKTTLAPAEQDMKVNREMEAVMQTQKYGTPLWKELVRVNFAKLSAG